MNVLIIGSGGREHALAAKVKESARVDRVFCIPGNAGTAEIAENAAVPLDPFDGLIAFARSHHVDLTIVGPEAPLCSGIVDAFQESGLCIFGPTAAAARIEGDKAYAKRLMKVASVPTAEARIFDRFAAAKAYVDTRDCGLVVKASGLAAGKGVVVCKEPAEAMLALERIMVQREFGDAGDTVVVEEVLQGPELSLHALIDDRTILLLDTAQDHKAAGDGDTGPNTGGMGAYSPAPIAGPDVLARIEREVLVPIVDALRNDGAPFRGVLYAGLMLTPGGPKVLEFNCRFGDPETQVLLPRIESDFVELVEAVIDGRLSDVEVRWGRKSAVCVVLASGGYPGKYESGKVITGLEAAATRKDVHVFHAGTSKVEHLTVTAGGRVLGVTAQGDDIAHARRRAYEAVADIHFEGMHYRRDIGKRAIHEQV